MVCTAGHVVIQCSDRDDVLSLGTFLALGDRELDFLAFGQGFEARTGDGAEVGKYVRTIFLLDEAKTFGFVEPFDGAGNSGHSNSYFIQE